MEDLGKELDENRTELEENKNELQGVEAALEKTPQDEELRKRRAILEEIRAYLVKTKAALVDIPRTRPFNNNKQPVPAISCVTLPSFSCRFTVTMNVQASKW